MSVWYRQSTKPGVNLVPVGVKGAIIFTLNVLAFVVPMFMVFGLWPSQTITLSLAILVFIGSILFFIYSLKYKADYIPHDQNEN